MLRRTLPLLIAASLLIPGTHATAATKKPAPKPVAPRVASLNYYGFGHQGEPFLTWNDSGNGPLPVLGDGGLGAVEFKIKPNDTAFRLALADASGQPAGGGLVYLDSNAHAIGSSITFCRALPSTAVPPAAELAKVYLDPTICPGPITKGTVTATITQKQPKHR